MITRELKIILEKVSLFWEVAPDFFPPEAALLERVAIITAFLDPGVRQAVLASAKLFHPGNIGRAAFCKEYPAAALLGEKPIILNQDYFVDIWKTQSLAKAMKIAVINPIFLCWSKTLMSFTKDFLVAWGIQNSRSIGFWQFDRLRQPRYFLHAHVNDNEDFENISYQEVISRLTDSKSQFFGANKFDSRPPTAIRSKPTLEQKIENEIRRRLAKSGLSDEKSIIETNTAIQNAILFELDSVSENRNYYILKNGSNVRSSFGGGAESRFYQCSTPTNGVLGAGDIETLIRRCTAEAYNPDCKHWAEAAALLISMAVWHRPDKLAALEVRWNCARSELTERSRHGQPDLHEPVGSKFSRFIPKKLADLNDQLRLRGYPNKEQIEAYLKSIRYWFSCSRLEQSLLVICPAVWKYPPVLPILGFHPLSESSPALRSYSRVDLRYIQQTEQWLNLFEPGLVITEDIFLFNSCGSPDVPKKEELKEFAITIKKLLHTALPSNFEDARYTYNAIVSGVHLFGNVLLGGLRNWPMLLPRWHKSGWIGYQKAPLLYRPSKILLKWLPELQDRTDELIMLCREDGVEVDMISLQKTSFSLFKRDSRNRLSVIPFCARDIAIALSLCAETWRWKGLYPGGMRHFSMSELYAAGFPSVEVEAFHHRSISSLHPFRKHRLESIASSDDRKRLESHLCSVLDL